MPTKKTELKRPSQTDTTFEPHFSINDLAAKWKLSRETILQLLKETYADEENRIETTEPDRHHV